MGNRALTGASPKLFCTIKMTPEMALELEEYRRKHASLPPRATAVRNLLAAALRGVRDDGEAPQPRPPGRRAA